ncbi:hypothetical protein TcG_05902 [Trypanosoma cruzi]|nr:hypothetical protein TcG_05902 [Trypanosoma cruzi]
MQLHEAARPRGSCPLEDDDGENFVGLIDADETNTRVNLSSMWMDECEEGVDAAASKLITDRLLSRILLFSAMRVLKRNSAKGVQARIPCETFFPSDAHCPDRGRSLKLNCVRGDSPLDIDEYELYDSSATPFLVSAPSVSLSVEKSECTAHVSTTFVSSIVDVDLPETPRFAMPHYAPAVVQWSSIQL